MTAPDGQPLPATPASAGALIFDRAGRLLILNPVYKSGWTIPGGVMEADGETPWRGCRREGREKGGPTVRHRRLPGQEAPGPGTTRLPAQTPRDPVRAPARRG